MNYVLKLLKEIAKGLRKCESIGFEMGCKQV